MRPTLRRLYERIDQDHGDIDEAEIQAYLKKIGVGDGVLGGPAVKMGTDEILALLDESLDRKIQWEEMVRGGKKLLPAELVDDHGHLDRTRVPQVFNEIVHGKTTNKDRADAKDLARYLLPEMKKRADSPLKAMFAPQAAAAAAKIGIDALAVEDGKTFTEADLFAIVDDINAKIDRL